jgi:Zn-dependent protease
MSTVRTVSQDVPCPTWRARLFSALTADVRLGSICGISLSASRALVYVAIALAITGDSNDLLLFSAVLVSILLHEFSHALVARRLRATVTCIRLGLLGGIASIDVPRDQREVPIALAGPVMSLALFILLSIADALVPAHAIRQAGTVNLVIATFNLLPAFPLDGGRVLRALVAQYIGVPRATRLAVTMTRGACVLFVIVGFLGPYQLIGVAVFLWFAGNAELRAVFQEELTSTHLEATPS